MKRFKVEIEFDENMKISVLFADSKKLSSFSIDGKFMLMEEEESFYNNITNNIKSQVLSLANDGSLSDFRMNGNSGASK